MSSKIVNRRTALAGFGLGAAALGTAAATGMSWQDVLEFMGARVTSGALDLRKADEVWKINRSVDGTAFVNEEKVITNPEEIKIVPGDILTKEQKFGVRLTGTNLVGVMKWATTDGGEFTEGALWAGTPAVAHEGEENVLDDNQTGTSDKGVKHQVIVYGPGDTVLYDSAAGGDPTRLAPTSEGVVEQWADSDDDYQFRVVYKFTFDEETPHQVRMDAEGEFKAARITLDQVQV